MATKHELAEISAEDANAVSGGWTILTRAEARAVFSAKGSLRQRVDAAINSGLLDRTKAMMWINEG